MFMGLDGFEWFQGVVEDRKTDPLKLGRLKVRIIGHHPQKKGSEQGIQTDELLWCHPMQSISDAAMNGIGETPIGVVEGTWVFGFFRDTLRQDAVVIGTLPGIPEDLPNGSVGFNDPEEKYPKQEFLNEPDTNRLARNDVDWNEYNEEQSNKNFNDGLTDYVYRPHGIIKTKRDNEEKTIPTAGFDAAGATYDEKTTSYASVYPFNHVRESESGHVHEIDDTPSHERLHTYHKTGTFEEIHPDGSKVTKIIGDDFEIVQQNKNVYIKGDLNITVDGDASFYCKKNVTQQVDGNVKQHIKGTMVSHVEKQVEINADESVLVNIGSDANINVDGSASIDVQESANINAADISVSAGNSMKLTAGNMLEIDAVNLTCTGSGVAIFTGGTVVVG
jgi:hypothetical protein